MKSKVFTLAHAIKSNFQSFSDALKAAWKIIKLTLSRQTEIKFAKKSGEIRKALALKIINLEDTIDRGFARFIEINSDGEEQFRSFKIERLIV